MSPLAVDDVEIRIALEAYRHNLCCDSATECLPIFVGWLIRAATTTMVRTPDIFSPRSGQ
jgi:hypothetical protein